MRPQQQFRTLERQARTRRDSFRTLRRHFFNRFFDSDAVSDGDDEREGLVHRLALLATPGLMLSFYMLISASGLRGGSPEVRAVLVCFSMAVTGMVMASRWEFLFPDRLDYRILTPLPIRVRDVFAARVAALAGFVSLYTIAVSAFPLLVAPLVFAASSPAPGWTAWPSAFAAHALGTLGGSVFMVLLFTALHGVLINVLPPAAFRRISPHVQSLAMAVLVGVLMIVPLLAGNIRPIAESGSRIFDAFPLAWFAGLYETTVPAGATAPAWSRWAWTGIWATLAAAAVSVAAYAVGYRRHARKLLESVDADNRPPGVVDRVAAWLLHRTLLRNPFDRAVFHFVGTVSARSPRHRILVAAYTGAGIALALSSLFVIDTASVRAFPFLISPVGVVEAPLIVSFMIVAGTRIAFGVPHEFRARWAFAFTEATACDFARATRRWILAARVVPLYAVIAVFELAMFDRATAVRHVVYDAAVTWLLVEISFFDFRDVPYTAMRKTRKLEVAVIAFAYLIAFSFFVDLAVAVQEAAVTTLPAAFVFLGAVAALGAGLSAWARRNPAARLMDFEMEPEIQDLGLS